MPSKAQVQNEFRCSQNKIKFKFIRIFNFVQIYCAKSSFVSIFDVTKLQKWKMFYE